jgi:GDP-L-fucose synthase
MKVLVTGGSGFVGKRLQRQQPDWLYPTSSEFNLYNHAECVEYLLKEKPDAVIHLAAQVGGIKDNSKHPADFFFNNTIMNTNIVNACHVAGIPRLLAALSTCAFPDVVDVYPFVEENLLDGPPALTNRAYGFTKRSLYIQIQSYRKQFGVDYSSFCPSNLYGPEDHFDPEKSHFVPASIKKIHEAEEGSEVEFWGTGKPLRQQLYVDDLCRAIPLLLLKHSTDLPIIVAPDENLSIKEMATICKAIIRKEVNFSFNGNLDGQYRKDGSNQEFKKLLPNFQFTSFREGLDKTYSWYVKNTILLRKK